MIYLHKILPLLVSPLAVVLYLMFWALLSRRRLPIALAMVLMLTISSPYVANRAISWIEADYPPIDLGTVPPIEAVVVLGGTRVTVRLPDGGMKYEFNTAVDRVNAGIALMQNGTGDQLIFTRGLLPWDHGVPEGEWLQEIAIERGVPPERIRLTEVAQNTDQEARRVAEMLGPEARIALVTSAYHMARSVRVFEAQGLDVVPVPVDHWQDRQDTTVMDFLPSGRAIMRTQLAMREALGLLYYRLRY